MKSTTTLGRRQFNRAALAAAASAFSFTFIPSRAWGQLEKPTLGAIGIGGKGASDLKGAHAAGFHVAALVDVVDARRVGQDKLPRNLGKLQGEFPDTPFFADYREMLDKMGDKVDAVTVSTPDHHHFHASYLAMKAGKHVYCQKPLTHSIWESRTLAQVAKETGVKTQMGNQAHANDHMRRCVELIRAGAIGKVREVHGWTNRPIWAQGFARPPASEPVPAWLNWEQWIGPAPFTEYSSKYAPFGWRGVWDFGCGALGDMACHILDLGWWAIAPAAPVSVFAEQHGGTEISPPISSKITWQFAPSKYTAAEGCKIHWYDGYPAATFDRESWSLVKTSDEYNHPSDDVLGGKDYRKLDTIIVGEAGKLYFNRSVDNWVLEASPKIDGFAWPKPSLPRAQNQDNYQEWFDAVTGKVARGESDFSVAGPFTEMILLGTIAQRIPKKTLVWDAAAMAIQDHPEASNWIRRKYRAGWELKNLA